MAEQSNWKPNKWHFYVGFQPGGKPSQDQYHRGTCDSVKKHYLEYVHERQAQVAELDDPRGDPRKLKSCCTNKMPEGILPTEYAGGASDPEPREQPGSKFFVAAEGISYHTYRGCEYLHQEIKDGDIYGFREEIDAKTKDAHDKQQPNDYKRGPCFSVLQRDEDGFTGNGETCFAKRKK